MLSSGELKTVGLDQEDAGIRAILLEESSPCEATTILMRRVKCNAQTLLLQLFPHNSGQLSLAAFQIGDESKQKKIKKQVA